MICECEKKQIHWIFVATTKYLQTLRWWWWCYEATFEMKTENEMEKQCGMSRIITFFYVYVDYIWYNVV